MIERFARIAGWIVLGLIVLVTVSPPSWRPDFGHVNVERFASFCIVGLLLGLAFPRHFLLVAAIVLGAAALLEAAQLLIPGRDGTPPNLILKIEGGVLGLGVAFVVNRLILLRKKPQP